MISEKAKERCADGFGALILAAGYSSRMGSFKPLLPVGEMPAIKRLVYSIYRSGIKDIIIVTGYNRELLLPCIKEQSIQLGAEGCHIFEAYNANYDMGMFSSICTGLEATRALSVKKDGYFLMPADCPLINEKILKAMMEKIEDKGRADEFCVPVFEGKKGHPLFIPECYTAEIRAYKGSGGLKAITDKYRDKMHRVSVDDESCILDMDTPEGYEEIKSFLKRGCVSEDIRELARGRRIFLIRHGETRRHSEKMFIGQYDVPLNDDGRNQIRSLAAELASFDINIGSIYCSDLSRGRESAEIIADRLEEKTGRAVSLCPKKELREINLGPWDGRPISEIKAEYPDEYRMRGEDIFTFKTGNKSENFYDLQYRSVKALRDILQQDKHRDIVIVTHSGVIRALENNLSGQRVDDEWGKIEKGCFICKTIE